MVLPAAGTGPGELQIPVHAPAPFAWLQLSAAMMLRFSLNQEAAAQRIEAAVQAVLAQGLRTREGTTRVGTAEMGDAVVAALNRARCAPRAPPTASSQRWLLFCPVPVGDCAPGRVSTLRNSAL